MAFQRKRDANEAGLDEDVGLTVARERDAGGPISTKFRLLQQAVFKQSVEQQDWLTAAAEWTLIHTYFDDGECVCSTHIQEHCVILNKHNARRMIVGNQCVQRFGGEMAAEARNAFRKLKDMKNKAAEGKSAVATEPLLAMCVERGMISEATNNLYVKIMQVRKRSEKQQKVIDDTNATIVELSRYAPQLCTLCQALVLPKRRRDGTGVFWACFMHDAPVFLRDPKDPLDATDAPEIARTQVVAMHQDGPSTPCSTCHVQVHPKQRRDGSGMFWGCFAHEPPVFMRDPRIAEAAATIAPTVVHHQHHRPPQTPISAIARVIHAGAEQARLHQQQPAAAATPTANATCTVCQAIVAPKPRRDGTGVFWACFAHKPTVFLADPTTADQHPTRVCPENHIVVARISPKTNAPYWRCVPCNTFVRP